MATPLGLDLNMINCPNRFELYHRYLAKAAQGKVVADIGAGTGLLSLAALRQGAKKVYAIERDERSLEYLLKLIRLAKAEDRIVPIHNIFGNLKRSNFPEDIDIFITETMGRAWFDEGIHEHALHALDLFPQASFVPGSAALYGQLFSDCAVFHENLRPTLPILKEIGFDKTYMSSYSTYPAGLYLCRDNFSDAEPRSEAFKILSRKAGERLNTEVSVELRLEEAIPDGAWMVLWFEADFGGVIAMNTNPKDHERYPSFRNRIFFVPAADQEISLHFKFHPETFKLSYQLSPVKEPLGTAP